MRARLEGVDVDGRPLRLADFRGERVLLDLWGLWCKPCVADLPSGTEALRVRAFPTTFVLDERGVIRHVGLRAEALERAVDELVAALAARQ